MQNMSYPNEIIEKKMMHIEKKCMEWKILDFLKPIKCGAETLHSSPFSFLGRMWFLEISTRKFEHKWISLFLHTKEANSSQSVTFTLGIKYLEEVIKERTTSHIFVTEEADWGWKEFCNIKYFLEFCENATEIPLTVYCYLEYHNTKHSLADAESQTLLHSAIALSCDLENLLASGRQSDVTVKVGDREFNVHKSILAARSPVFAAMFSHDMSEKNNGIVHIDDCNPDAFHNFLKSMYTGNLKFVSIDDLTSFYTLADKYSVTDLKETCVQFMIEELSVDSVCNILVLADKHNEIVLKICAEEFLIANLKNVVPTNNFKSFMSECTSLAHNILINSFSGSS